MTLIEVCVVLCLLTILFVLVVPAHSSRGKSERIRCANNLKQTAQAFRTFANDHDNRFPFEVPDLVNQNLDRRAWTQFLVLSNELGSPKILWCPGDPSGRSAATTFSAGPTFSPQSLAQMQNNAISYFIGVGARSNWNSAILAGDCNLAPNPTAAIYVSRRTNPFVIVSTNSIWSTNQPHHDWAGNLALKDGSVQQVTRSALQTQLQQAAETYGPEVNRFLFPQ